MEGQFVRLFFLQKAQGKKNFGQIYVLNQKHNKTRMQGSDCIDLYWICFVF